MPPVKRKRVNKMTRYELECIYDNHKSFYGKAFVEIREASKACDPCKTLYSYNTKVACIFYHNLPNCEYDETFEIYGFYSSTTLRHIKEFAQQEGYPAMNKKQLEEYEV